MVSSPPSYLTAGADRLDSGVQTNTISVQTSTCDLSREATDKSERERKKKRKKHKKDKRRKSQMADPVVTDLMDGKGISVENSGGFYSDHGNAHSSGDENDIAERTFLLLKKNNLPDFLPCFILNLPNLNFKQIRRSAVFDLHAARIRSPTWRPPIDQRGRNGIREPWCPRSRSHQCVCQPSYETSPWWDAATDVT